MIKAHWILGLSVGITAAGLGGCASIKTDNTVHIEQSKPLEIDVNLHADINVVITDARRDMEQIKGGKPTREVRPEDIGLDAGDIKPSSMGAAVEARPVALLADLGTPQRHAVARMDDLKAAMATRNAAVRAILDTHNAGEAHTGLLEKRGTLTGAQQQTMDAENKDRQELYTAEAQQKGTTVDKVALGYYVARLGYAKKGDWYEKFNKDKKAWEWATWDQ